jgi:hypothetical protein
MYAPATGQAKPVEEEVITEENVFERPDETIAFFPKQVLYDLFVSTLILLACCVLSYVLPAPLSEPADRRRLRTYQGRSGSSSSTSRC